MQHLSSYYNTTVHRFELPGSGVSRDYLLEINPNWANTRIDDVDDKINARWLEMSLYFDIATLGYDDHTEREDTKGVVMCKDGHHVRRATYSPSQIPHLKMLRRKFPQPLRLCWRRRTAFQH